MDLQDPCQRPGLKDRIQALDTELEAVDRSRRTYRFTEHRPTTWRVRPTLDFGVGITSDRPAFFLGGGVEIWRAARIGVGWAPQRVTKLAEDQVPGETIVASTDEIRTVKEFEAKNWYVSVSFALDSLSLFKKD